MVDGGGTVQYLQTGPSGGVLGHVKLPGGRGVKVKVTGHRLITHTTRRHTHHTVALKYEPNPPRFVCLVV